MSFFRGANGPWKTGDYEFHLKAPAAKNLLALVLKTYTETHGGPPKELFIHGQTYFNDEEWNAFVESGAEGDQHHRASDSLDRRRDQALSRWRLSCAARDRTHCSIIRQLIFGRLAMCRNSTPTLGPRRPIRYITVMHK